MATIVSAPASKSATRLKLSSSSSASASSTSEISDNNGGDGNGISQPTAATGGDELDQNSDNQSGEHNRLMSAGAATSDRIFHNNTSTSMVDNSNLNKHTYNVEHLATFSTSDDIEHHNGQRNVARPDYQSLSDEATTTNRDNLDSQQQQRTSGRLKKSRNFSITKPRVALENLFELEKLSGIWTQRMQIELSDDGYMLIIDCETNSIVERFESDSVIKPEAFREFNDIYSNIIVFIIKQQQRPNTSKCKKVDQLDSSPTSTTTTTPSSDGDQQQEEGEKSRTATSNDELHIFQCVSHKAQQLVEDILAWKQQQQPSKMNESYSSTATYDKNPCKSDLANAKRDDKKSSRSLTSVDHQQDNKNTSKHEQQQPADGSETSSAPPQVAASSQAPTATTDDNSSQQQQVNAGKSSSTTTTDGTTHMQQAMSNGKPPVVVTAAAASANNETLPIVNVNVKETVQVFNQIAALREKSKPNSPTNNNGSGGASARPLSDTSLASSQQSNQELKNQSAAALGSSGQLYRRRSIRATLASSTNGQQQPEDQPNKTASYAQRTSGHADSSSLSSSSSSSGSNALDRQQQQQQLANQRLDSANKTRVESNNKFANGNSQQQQQARQQQRNSAATKQHSNSNNNHHHLSNSSSSASSASRLGARSSPPTQLSQQQQQQLEQITTNESYVSVLNHCFDDIEKFIIRLQHAAAAARELQIKRKLSKRSNQYSSSSAGFMNGPINYEQQNTNKPTTNGSTTASVDGHSIQQQQPPPIITASELAMLSAKARGPNEEDYFEILSKFKLAFNLLAKLKGCIHEPNAPELVHFLFTPLAIIIEAARNVAPHCIDPAQVGIPYLNRDALELLSNCCTSKESDMWHSLGPNWTQTIDSSLLKASRLPSSFQPIFSDGWAPIITELELIGLVVPPPPPTSSADLINAANDEQHCRGGRRYVEPALAADEDEVGGAANSYRTPPTQLGPQAVSAASQHRAARRRSGSSPPITSRSNNRLPPVQPFNGDRDDDHDGGPYDDRAVITYGYPAALTDRHHNSRPKSSSRRPLSGDLAGVHGQQVPPMIPYQHHMVPARSDRHLLPPDYAVGNYHSTTSATTATTRTGFHGQAMAVPPPDDYTGADLQPVEQQSLAAGGPSSHYRRSRHSEYSLAGSRQSHYQQSAVSPDAALNNARRRSSATGSKQPTMSAGYYAPSSPHGRQARQRALSQQQQHQHRRHHHQRHEQEEGNQDGDDGGPFMMFHDEQEREAMLIDLGPAQTDWFFELQTRGALIVRVLFSREANKDKELSVRRGELLEILDDTRKWWKARNIDLQVAYVPHTIVAVIDHYQTLDELLLANHGSQQQQHHPHQQPAATDLDQTQPPAALLADQQFAYNNQRQRIMHSSSSRHHNIVAGQMFDDHQMVEQTGYDHHRKDKRNAKTAGAFRYF